MRLGRKSTPNFALFDPTPGKYSTVMGEMSESVLRVQPRTKPAI